MQTAYERCKRWQQNYCLQNPDSNWQLFSMKTSLSRLILCLYNEYYLAHTQLEWIPILTDESRFYLSLLCAVILYRISATHRNIMSLTIIIENLWYIYAAEYCNGEHHLRSFSCLQKCSRAWILRQSGFRGCDTQPSVCFNYAHAYIVTTPQMSRHMNFEIWKKAAEWWGIKRFIPAVYFCVISNVLRRAQ